MGNSQFKNSLSSQVNLSVIIASSIGLIIALAWNNAFTSLIDTYVPESQSKGVLYKFIYALLLTICVWVLIKKL